MRVMACGLLAGETFLASLR